ncbi:dienelactone hydrolase family protein [Viridibacillus sp. YIM B01967]|uniref:Dienelactone hydrolase family protein n=1 Tax=Viridibacillus soli TaxID=2798301 RepID=A0ABS1HD49_9BACL|nr:dienelactone hydrolase family protein [Viridibacillus soli]MBK3497360.1 dienelactone hydrolase family protein [Viridibacillus soli]
MAVKKSLVILLHEIYGVNNHMKYYEEIFCDAGFDVLIPNLLGRNPFDYNHEKEAYTHFMAEVGFEKSEWMVDQIIREQKLVYKNIYIVGFSIGATLAWLCSEKSVNGVIAYYGSRIRQYVHINPTIPTAVYIAKQEKSFDARKTFEQLHTKKQVYARLIEGHHGFMNPFDKNFDRKKATELINESLTFLHR